jgi:Predicted DNA modification methylase
METLAFELSGEHGTLPKSEVIAAVETYGWTFQVLGDYDQLLIIETDADPVVLAGRLALTHNILRLIFTCPAGEEEILKHAETADLGLREGQTFVVRVSRVKTYGPISASFERTLGAVIWHRDHPVSLDNPDVVFRAVVTESICAFGALICPVNRTAFDDRAPLKKPFFLPGVLMPRISRAVVNLTRIRDGRILDPFAGTGGTLVEAGLISRDIRVVGCDIQKKMVHGMRMNYRFYGVSFDVVRQDSLSMGIRDGSVDAVVTDFPYGQSTPIAAASPSEFYAGAIAEMYRVLKPGRRAVVVSKEPMEKLLTDAGFNVVETHRQRIHRSLTRQIVVAEKPADEGM